MAEEAKAEGSGVRCQKWAVSSKAIFLRGMRALGYGASGFVYLVQKEMWHGRGEEKKAWSEATGVTELSKSLVIKRFIAVEDQWNEVKEAFLKDLVAQGHREPGEAERVVFRLTNLEKVKKEVALQIAARERLGHIVPEVHACGETTDGNFVVIMDRLEGMAVIDLELRAHQNKLSYIAHGSERAQVWALIPRVASDLLTSLFRLHKRDEDGKFIAHRDISNNNIYFTKRAWQIGTHKSAIGLIDFGNSCQEAERSECRFQFPPQGTHGFCHPLLYTAQYATFAAWRRVLTWARDFERKGAQNTVSKEVKRIKEEAWGLFNEAGMGRVLVLHDWHAAASILCEMALVSCPKTRQGGVGMEFPSAEFKKHLPEVVSGSLFQGHTGGAFNKAFRKAASLVDNRIGLLAALYNATMEPSLAVLWKVLILSKNFSHYVEASDGKRYYPTAALAACGDEVKLASVERVAVEFANEEKASALSYLQEAEKVLGTLPSNIISPSSDAEDFLNQLLGTGEIVTHATRALRFVHSTLQKAVEFKERKAEIHKKVFGAEIVFANGRMAAAIANAKAAIAVNKADAAASHNANAKMEQRDIIYLDGQLKNIEELVARKEVIENLERTTNVVVEQCAQGLAYARKLVAIEEEIEFEIKEGKKTDKEIIEAHMEDIKTTFDLIQVFLENAPIIVRYAKENVEALFSVQSGTANIEFATQAWQPYTTAVSAYIDTVATESHSDAAEEVLAEEGAYFLPSTVTLRST